MTKPHRATPEQWEHVEQRILAIDPGCACLLELRARVEALEAQQRTATPEARTGGLVERVLNAMDEHVGVNYYTEARAAIREVAAAARDLRFTTAQSLIAWLEREANNG